MGPISLKFKIILIECKFYSQTIGCFDKENKLLKIQKTPVNIVWRKFSDVRDSTEGKRNLHSSHHRFRSNGGKCLTDIFLAQLFSTLINLKTFLAIYMNKAHAYFEGAFIKSSKSRSSKQIN